MAVTAPNLLRREPDALLRVPVATYRLQLGPQLTFDDAAELAEYLRQLGITDVYTSPFFEAASASSHGYDVSDHNRVRAELGGEPALRRFGQALGRHELGLVIDLVPNHMGIAHAKNAWWRDVLENGPSSPYASFFDIDWRPVKAELADKVLLPILGDQYGSVLESGQLRLELGNGLFELCYWETRLPIAPQSTSRVLAHRLATFQAALGPDHPDLLELKSIIVWSASIPSHTETDQARLAARYEMKETGRQRLVKLREASGPVREFIDENLRIFNGTPGDSRSFDLLDSLLRDQAYRLAYWRVAGEEINYRRFFDINELAAIRMELLPVFEETHRLVFDLIRDGMVTGLRIDHPDGLYGPAEYFRRLQERAVHAVARPIYIVAEKILSPGERLPDTWAVAGTTGYEFLNLVNGVFVDRSQARAMDLIYTRLLRERASFTDVVYESKRLIMETSMASELNMLGHRVNRISEKHRSSRDFTLRSLTRALREIVACFPVYRTYFGEQSDDALDREHLTRAVDLARGRARVLDLSIYDWLRDLLSRRVPSWADQENRAERADVLMRFQQITGPVTAKGYEDTALYRYHRLVSLNEVGGDPSRFGTSPAELHAALAERQTAAPAGLSATATHDTKRGEDVRARINVLSDIPFEWRGRVARWQRLNRRHRTVVDGEAVPGPNEEYFVYQTLVGAWPIDADRMAAYVAKAMHEAKVSTSWITPNARYDEAMDRFVRTIVDPRHSREFLRDFAAFHARIAHFGILNSLAQLVIKITAPGIPDFYQGTELWDLSLVDPDNRRPVDFAARRQLLDALVKEIDDASDLAGLARQLAKNPHDGRVKLYVTHQALAFRRRCARLFLRGNYLPVETAGPFAEHLFAFARVHEDAAALIVVPRLLGRRGVEELPIGELYWADTRLTIPPRMAGRFRDVFTGRHVEVENASGTLLAGHVLGEFPVAVLAREA